MRYKLNVGMSYPASANVIAELTALAELPEEERQSQVSRIMQTGGFLRAEAGAIVENLPAISIPWLLEQGHIVELDDKPIVVKMPKAKAESTVEVPIVPVAAPEGE